MSGQKPLLLPDLIVMDMYTLEFDEDQLLCVHTFRFSSNLHRGEKGVCTLEVDLHQTLV